MLAERTGMQPRLTDVRTTPFYYASVCARRNSLTSLSTDDLAALRRCLYPLLASRRRHSRLFGHVYYLLILRMSEMITGTVKFFNESKGYGFIAPENGSGDAFVHISAVERAGMRTLVQDQRISYELETDRRGKTSAVNLQAA